MSIKGLAMDNPKSIHTSGLDIQKVYHNNNLIWDMSALPQGFDGPYPEKLSIALNPYVFDVYGANPLNTDRTWINPVNEIAHTLVPLTKATVYPVIRDVSINGLATKALTTLKNASSVANYLRFTAAPTTEYGSLLRVGLIKVNSTTLSETQTAMHMVGISNLNTFTLTNSGNITFAKYYGGVRFSTVRPYWCILWGFGTGGGTNDSVGPQFYRDTDIECAEYYAYKATEANYLEIKDAVVAYIKNKYNLTEV